MPQVHVCCVHLHQYKHTPLALGYIVAMLHKYRPELAAAMKFSWVRDSDLVKEDSWLAQFKDPAIFLMSDYPWNIRAHLALSRKLKDLNPRHLIIQGGPYVPYKNSSFLEQHPYIDFLVHREGEFSGMELLSQILTEKDYQAVNGISYRHGLEIRMTEPREPILDMTVVPSPFLEGVFDPLLPELDLAVLETNRGCPFKCAFCSWNMDLAKVVKQDLNRVFQELDWIGRHQVTSLFIADANFGILEQDVAIAEEICKVKARYGFPKNAILIHGNNAKRSIEISRRLIASQIVTNLVLAIQTLDEATLKNITRKPIAMDYFKQVRDEYIRQHLPVAAQFMIGLPGSTYASFKHDVDYIIREKMYPMIFTTMILPNSRMDEPEYRRQFQIETVIQTSADGNWELIVQTNSFSREEYRRILLLCMFTSLAFGYRTLKYLVYFAAMEARVNPSHVLELLMGAGQEETAKPEETRRYPVLATVMAHLGNGLVDFFEKKIFRDIKDNARDAYLLMEGRNLWEQFYREASTLLTENLGLDPALIQTVILVQQRILPSRYNPRSPVTLPYDFTAFYSQTGNGGGHRSLKTYAGPVAFTVEDPRGVCTNPDLVYRTMRDLPNYFELNSPLWRIS